MLAAWTTTVTAAPHQVQVGPARVWLRPFYSAYERWLARQVTAAGRPRHIGIILDGNRRHGKRCGLHEPRDIYDLGARKLDDVLGWCGELAVPAVTLWVCSTDNLDRPPHQVSGILAAVEAKLRALSCDPVIHLRRVRVQAIGKLQLLPASLLAAIEAAQEATSGYDGMVLTIAVAYGGREEIADAVHALLSEQASQGATLADVLDHITPAAIGRHIYMAGGSRPRPHHPHQRRNPAVRLPAVAERLQRVLLLRRGLAGVPHGGLPARGAGLPAAPAALRPVTSTSPILPRDAAARER